MGFQPPHTPSADLELTSRTTSHRSGICGSDVHYWTHGRIGDFVLTSPMVLGHESAGIVSRVGPGVDTHKVGDRVALEPGVPCLKCDICKAGIYNHCEEVSWLAVDV